MWIVPEILLLLSDALSELGSVKMRRAKTGSRITTAGLGKLNRNKGELGNFSDSRSTNHGELLDMRFEMVFHMLSEDFGTSKNPLRVLVDQADVLVFL